MRDRAFRIGQPIEPRAERSDGDRIQPADRRPGPPGEGTVVELREPDRAQLERAERHLEAFTAEARRLGYPPDLVGRLYGPADLLAVTLSIEEVFDQTPGPSAGKRL